jgi:hypothetical protein
LSATEPFPAEQYRFATSDWSTKVNSSAIEREIP